MLEKDTLQLQELTIETLTTNASFSAGKAGNIALADVEDADNN
jgi:hypothetical protein